MTLEAITRISTPFIESGFGDAKTFSLGSDTLVTFAVLAIESIETLAQDLALAIEVPSAAFGISSVGACSDGLTVLHTTRIVGPLRILPNGASAHLPFDQADAVPTVPLRSTGMGETFAAERH